jgi:hypothetical protein
MDRMIFSTDHPDLSMKRAPAFLAGLLVMPHDRAESTLKYSTSLRL